jgi:hypothetical protein
MKRAKAVGPVGPEEIQKLRDAQLAIANAMPVVRQLEACGDDCKHWRELFAHYDKELRQIEKVFTSPPPSES